MENKEDILKTLQATLQTKENLKTQLETAFQQVVGQIVLLKELIKTYGNNKEEPKKE